MTKFSENRFIKNWFQTYLKNYYKPKPKNYLIFVYESCYIKYFNKTFYSNKLISEQYLGEFYYMEKIKNDLLNKSFINYKLIFTFIFTFIFTSIFFFIFLENKNSLILTSKLISFLLKKTFNFIDVDYLIFSRTIDLNFF